MPLLCPVSLEENIVHVKAMRDVGRIRPFVVQKYPLALQDLVVTFPEDIKL